MRQLAVFAVAAIAAAALNPPPAWAQATSTFVSGDGLDTNPCTLAAPCRSFQRAHDQTAAGGQVTMLDPAGYGRLTITKAISIVNDGGGEAGINDPGEGSNAITINAGASDVVTLRGLTLNGVGTGGAGILFNSGGTLNIQNCVIRDFTGDGVAASPAASAAVTIADTIASNNGSSGVNIFQVSGITVTADLERIAVIGNTHFGIRLVPSGAALTQATIVDSVAIGNGTHNNGQGFVINASAASVVTLINFTAIGNGVGVETAGSGGVTNISGTTIAGNTDAGFQISGGPLKTFGDNYIIDTTNVGTLTSIAEQ